MKIAFVIINANRHEGTSRAVLEVAERLAAWGHEVDLWARTYEPKPDSKPLNWIRVAGPSRPEILDFESFRITCERRLKSTNYDIIHSAGPNTAIANVYTIQTVHPVKVQQFAPLRAGSKAGVMRRLSWSLYDSRVVSAERRAYQSTGVRGPKAYLPVSAGTKEELLKEYPQLAFSKWDSTSVIPNGADLERFHPRNREAFSAEVRKQQNLAADDFVLLFSGGDWRRKGLDLALRALALIHSPKVKLLVVGHDRAGADVRELCSELGLDNRVRFAGFCKDIHRYYAAGDLFLFPTAYEAFSLATIEAASSGLPVLMPNVSGAEELIGCGQCGAMIDRDPGHIAETVTRYLNAPELLKTHGAAARAKVERAFNWDVIATKTLDVYHHLINQRVADVARLPG